MPGGGLAKRGTQVWREKKKEREREKTSYSTEVSTVLRNDMPRKRGKEAALCMR